MQQVRFSPDPLASVNECSERRRFTGWKGSSPTVKAPQKVPVLWGPALHTDPQLVQC